MTVQNTLTAALAEAQAQEPNSNSLKEASAQCLVDVSTALREATMQATLQEAVQLATRLPHGHTNTEQQASDTFLKQVDTSLGSMMQPANVASERFLSKASNALRTADTEGELEQLLSRASNQGVFAKAQPAEQEQSSSAAPAA